MIAGKEIRMAKVELITTANGGTGVINPCIPVTKKYTEYSNKVWEEYKAWSSLDELLKARKTVQRKIDATRKRLKRVSNRLNTIERNWAIAA